MKRPYFSYQCNNIGYVYCRILPGDSSKPEKIDRDEATTSSMIIIVDLYFKENQHYIFQKYFVDNDTLVYCDIGPNCDNDTTDAENVTLLLIQPDPLPTPSNLQTIITHPPLDYVPIINVVGHVFNAILIVFTLFFVIKIKSRQNTCVSQSGP